MKPDNDVRDEGLMLRLAKQVAERGIAMQEALIARCITEGCKASEMCVVQRNHGNETVWSFERKDLYEK